MAEKDLINKIKELKNIKPKEDWVFLTKNRIFSEEQQFSLSPFESFKQLFNLKPAFVISSLINVGLVGLTFVFSVQSSLPGDLLYSVKKIGEDAQLSLSSETEKPGAYLELANKRLEDLDKIAKINKIENLVPTIREFQNSISKAVEDLNRIEDDSYIIMEIVSQTKKLEESKQRIEALGIVIGETKELDNALAQLIERELEGLENQILTEEQEESLVQVKEDYQAGLYYQALEGILFLGQ